MFDFTQERVFNDLSAISTIDDSQTLSAPGAPTVTAAGAVSGSTLLATTYYYKITAITAKGETTAGTQGSVTLGGAGLSATLAWTAVTDSSGVSLTGYNVYRGTVSGTVYYLGTTITNAYTDNGLTVPGTVDVPPSVNTTFIATDEAALGTKALVVQRLNKYLATGLSGNIYKRSATSPVNAVGTIVLPTTGNVAGTYRLEVDVTMSGSYPIDYDRWAINKGKPFFVEVYVPNSQTGDVLAATLAAGFTKGLKKYNGQNIKDIAITYTANSGTNAGSIIVTAANEYMRFLTDTSQLLQVQLLDSTGETFAAVASGTVTTQGVEGFGTAWFITKNLRIPTQEATRFYGENQDERPVNGVLYNQYTFQYSALRNFSGVGAVGSKSTSLTTHVFYIPTTLAATFEGYLTTVFGAASLVDAQSNLFLN